MPWIIGGLGVAGDLLGGLFGSSAQSKANKANIKLNRENRDWMERMSNTSWQRGVEDMKAASLNPMLAFNQGGASTPNNSAATVEPEDAIARGVSSAGTKAMNMLVADNMTADTILKSNTSRKTGAEAATAEVTSANAALRQNLELFKIEQEIRGVMNQADLTHQQKVQIEKLLPQLYASQEAQVKLLGQQTSAREAEEKTERYKHPSAKAEADVWEKLGAAGRGDNIGANALQQILSIIRSMKK